MTSAKQIASYQNLEQQFEEVTSNITLANIMKGIQEDVDIIKCDVYNPNELERSIERTRVIADALAREKKLLEQVAQMVPSIRIELMRGV